MLSVAGIAASFSTASRRKRLDADHAGSSVGNARQHRGMEARLFRLHAGFLFESRLVMRPTEFVMNPLILRHESFECRQGLKKRLAPEIVAELKKG